MAIEAGDFRTGLTLLIDGDPWQVLDFQHVKPGKGAAILKTKMKNLKTGATLERNFNANVKFDSAVIEKKAAQFSYESDGTYYFMDNETFDTYEISEEAIGFSKYFLNDGMEVSISFFDGNVLNVILPDKVEVEITETTPAVKGAPSTQTKDATISSGLTLKVPQFIDNGEKIIVSTIDGKYAGRA